MAEICAMDVVTDMDEILPDHISNSTTSIQIKERLGPFYRLFLEGPLSEVPL